jgi:hypothetical protein
MAHASGLNTAPRTVAELGPGNSAGVGMAALLSGSERYWALDVANYANPKRNLAIFDELVDLFRRRAPIPNELDFAEAQPVLDSYEFPQHLLTEERLRATLAPERLARLRDAIRVLGARPGSDQDVMSYMVSWHEAGRVRPSTVDAIFSQAVLEHVEDLVGTYDAMQRWLRPGGFMSHQIDFRSHGTTTAWNGHWAVSDISWRIAKGRREYFLNREPCSRHLRILAGMGFKVVCQVPQLDATGIERSLLAPRFRNITDDDLKTCGVFLQAVKTPGQS